MYSVSAQTNDVGVVKVPQTTEFDIDVEAILAAAAAAGCTANNLRTPSLLPVLQQFKWALLKHHRWCVNTG